MSKGTLIRTYDYVNHPYDRVRGMLCANPNVVFQAATKAAASKASNLATELRVEIGGMHLAADVSISVKRVVEQAGEGTTGGSTSIQLEWAATSFPHLFPFMKAELSIYPLTRSETQLDFSGIYEPPLGILGSAMNSLVGHRIAEESVQCFVADVAQYLRRTLA